MKKIAFLLALCLLLTGCAVGEIPEENEEELSQKELLQSGASVVQYLPDDPLTQASGGALRLYALTEGKYALLPLENGILLFLSETEQTHVFLLRGDTLTATAETTVSGTTTPEQWQENTAGNAFSWYDGANKCYRIYDSALRQTRQITIPAEHVENACISGDFLTVYYSTGTDLMVHDVAQDLSRPLRIGGEGTKQLLGLCAEDTLLAYHDLLSDRTDFCLIDTATGQQKQILPDQSVWRTDGETYDCLTSQNCLVIASFGGKERELRLGDTARITDVTAGGKVLAAEENTLAVYDTASGKKTAQITLPEGYEEATALFAPGKDGVWILGESSLLYWDHTLSAVQDSTVYTKEVK